MFRNIFKNKKVIVTGHTGFKGSWLSLWLNNLGANVIGISNDIPTRPSFYKALNLNKKIKDYKVDVTDLKKINKIIISNKPDFIFHLAAQSLVSLSYKIPINTFNTNSIGTLNILESLRNLKHKCVAIFITSDKCYQNVEWDWGYRENDRLGGKDPYSSSKAIAELMIYSYHNSLFKKNILISSCRAGNVIGGGDWAKDRLVPDCIRSFSKKRKVVLRNPKSTRPWQHVLEPLSGYLNIAMELYKNDKLNGESFNFGPNTNNDYSVLEVVEQISKLWDNSIWKVEKNNKFFESKLLKLNCDKALYNLDWKPSLEFEQTIKYTVDWYKNYYFDIKNIENFTYDQIDSYQKIAFQKKIKWTQN
ncbi:MAG: CDP-glucose 4,6-dehydratase [Candidatus Endolissoclinum sp. TMED37]|nr:MAG: CDP-glucose 4,6-dehydratase [Candidatus Endolissoclinum sp. TMED37]